MLDNKELRLINEVFKDIDAEGEVLKLKSKLDLLIEQMDLMEKATKEVEEIRQKILKLEEPEEEVE